MKLMTKLFLVIKHRVKNERNYLLYTRYIIYLEITRLKEKNEYGTKKKHTHDYHVFSRSNNIL